MRYKSPTRGRSNSVPLGWQQEIPSTSTSNSPSDLFQRASGHFVYDGKEGIWDPILKLLNLPLCYQPAIAIVLSEGRWRTATDPKAYVATAAYNQAVKMSLSNRGFADIKRVSISSKEPCEESREEAFDNYLFKAAPETSGIVSDADPDVELSLRIPNWLKNSNDEIDWKTVARWSGAKLEMRRVIERVLRLRFSVGLSRDRAVEMVKSKEEKREIEAAWKWIDRNKVEQIFPLFHLDQPPSSNKKRTRTKAAFVEPWEALRAAHNRERSVVGFSSPSMMTEPGYYPNNTMPIAPRIGVWCRIADKIPESKWPRDFVKPTCNVIYSGVRARPEFFDKK